MKKAVLALVLALVLISVLGAEDLKARTSSGLSVILHDNGTWEYAPVSLTDSGYVGKWEMKEEALDSLIDEYLASSGIDTSSPTYSFYKDYMRELIFEQLKSVGMTTVITLVLNADGTCSVTSGDESADGTYSVSDEREITVTFGDNTIAFGQFDEAYTRLTIMNEEFFFLTKAE